MGKGDRRSRRGKLFRGTYGKKRPRKAPQKAAAPASQPQQQAQPSPQNG